MGHQRTDAATQAHFAARAAQYGGSGEASLGFLLELADARPGERVLDVATGTGMALFPLAERVGPSGLAAGVDFTPAMLEQAARQREGRRVSLVAAHGGRLPFGPGRFDAVTCRYGVHHFSDAPAVLGELAATLRPGGRLVIADFVRPEDEAEGAAQDRLEALRGHVYVRIFSVSRLEALLGAAGCPVAARREARREILPRDLLDGPNVAPGDREALAAEVAALEARGGAGLELRRGDGEARLVRTDAVLLGIKGG